MTKTNERFADVQLLRYELKGFGQLSARQKAYIYYLSEAALCGRDIITDQHGRYNLLIRKTIEAVYTHYKGSRDDAEYLALELYLKQIWFANGIYHHYSCDKFTPDFTPDFLQKAFRDVPSEELPLTEWKSADELFDTLRPIIFDPQVLPKRVNQDKGSDLVITSACNYYEGVTQQEAEDYYNGLKKQGGAQATQYGLNSRLVKVNGKLHEEQWTVGGLYDKAISRIVYWLEKACAVAENEKQQECIRLLVEYYKTGNLKTFDQYSIEWLQETQGQVDFINGFIEVYGDPLGFKGSWEGLVEYVDKEATRRTQTISDNAQWFEDHSPVDKRFRKPVVKGVTAKAICAAMLGGDEYPSTAIGINLPNADWIRAQYGSKSITITNITDAYNKAARGNGFREEFVPDEAVRLLIGQYADLCDELHTDLHECLGHGSGQLLPGVSADALKEHGNTIEEARADLYGLYFIADEKLVELGLLPDMEAYKSHYYTYILNGLMTQLTRIKRGCQIEEAHMRNRALIAHWAMEHSDGNVRLVKHDGKTSLEIDNYEALRNVFARLLAEIQRIKSEGDYTAASEIVERYGVKVDATLHEEVLERYAKLNLAPYKGFINPVLKPVYDSDGSMIDVQVSYDESYAGQMLRYSREYGFL